MPFTAKQQQPPPPHKGSCLRGEAGDGIALTHVSVGQRHRTLVSTAGPWQARLHRHTHTRTPAPTRAHPTHPCLEMSY